MLKSVTIPNSVVTIGRGAFESCDSLRSVIIPNSVTTIGEDAFSYCSSLASVTIPNSVTTIGKSAFRFCSSLASVTIPNSVTTIGESAFSFCSSLASVTIPNSVTTIGESAFYDCRSLASVTIPNSVTTIGKYAFKIYDLESVTIGSNVTSIDSEAFTDVTKVIWLTDTPPSGYSNVKGKIHYVANDSYTGLSNTKVYPYLSSMFEVGGIKYVPVSISDNTCDAIDCIYPGDPYDVKIDNKVNYKGVDIIVRNINPYTGFHCKNIKSIDISSDGEIGNRAFSSCYNLQDVSIGDSVKSIGQEAFRSCSRLSRLALGTGLQAIGESAFSDCNNVTEISCEALVPPTCDTNALDDINKWTCKLIVPKASMEAYKQAEQWKEFFFIENNTTGIHTMTSDKDPRSDVYSLTGAKILDNASLQDVQSLPKGIYIIKGKKIIVK